MLSRALFTAFSLVAIGTAIPQAVVSTSYAADRSALVGTWSGKLASGASVRIKVSEKGNPSYSFKGASVRVNGASFSAKSVKLNVGRGGGVVTLTVTGEASAGYTYRFGSDFAKTTLTKS